VGVDEVKSTVAGGVPTSTALVTDVDNEHPPAVFTVSFTGNLPTPVYKCVGVGEVLVPPSPKSQA
jgi:hypothetical protein